MADTPKYVYFFGGGQADGSTDMKNSLGGKGANLAEMTRIGVQVPAGFTIPTEVCNHFSDNDGAYPDGLREQVATALTQVEDVMGAKLGCDTNPLLVSCRSGARESMPGMMDTVLNIGLNENSVQALANHSGNEQFAWDSYRRFIQMFGDVVLEVRAGDDEHEDPFEVLLEAKKMAAGVKYDSELSAEQLQQLVAEFKAEVQQRTGQDFPDDPIDQIWAAVGAVFGSWNNDRAVVYRRDYGIPHGWGTACNVQAMVYGNLGDDCATGVGLTRDCSMGAPGFNGDYLINAQGEDVVAGIRTPKRIETSLKDEMPEVYEQLETIGKTLENHYQDVQDIEFTVQKGRVWLLQTRNAKRTGFAAVRIAVDLVNEGLITPEQALDKRRIPADDLNQLLQPVFDPQAKADAEADGRLLTKGINAGPGAASGTICLTAAEAERLHNINPDEPLILVRRETSPEDLRGMRAAQGILTAFGGASSHAALVSRQMGKTCIVGANELNVDYTAGTVSVGDTVLKTGDPISIDGFTGEVFTGMVKTTESEIVNVLIKKTVDPDESLAYQNYAQLMEWVDQYRTLGVRTNADLPDQAIEAVAFGAEGIGLCRTEHMFLEHLEEIREMILARDPDTRLAAINRLLPFQQEEFTGLFRTMQGRPVTIRLLDPPLHEFLSERHLEEQPDLADRLATQLGISIDEVRARTAELHEENPMLGHRGCRLGIVYPEITAMQARAIMQAAVTVAAEGIDVHPEVMVPLVAFQAEIDNQAEIVHKTAKAVFAETGTTIEYQIGTMIEVPRAALRSDEIAKTAEFFSFGTNDLTQTCLGMSRDDYGGFIGYYQENDIVPFDPFQSIDPGGVGRLIELGVAGGRSTRSDLKIGICGEHGGDPASVMFCHRAGLNYVSCSPYRVPIARLAAAQEALASAT
ncbi:MAG: pyruvate, phosphate dikinase [Planctomycetaceae bacterium]